MEDIHDIIRDKVHDIFKNQLEYPAETESAIYETVVLPLITRVLEINEDTQNTLHSIAGKIEEMNIPQYGWIEIINWIGKSELYMEEDGKWYRGVEGLFCNSTQELITYITEL